VNLLTTTAAAPKPAASKPAVQKYAAQKDAFDVLCALRLGWGVAEFRGRNRPGGPVNGIVSMPANSEHALPLRIERSPTELRIEVQYVVATLAEDLHIGVTGEPSLEHALDGRARLLAHVRAPTASAALQQALDLLTASDVAAPALAVLGDARTAQSAIVAHRKKIAAAARKALAEAADEVAAEAGHLEHEEAAQLAAQRATTVLKLETGIVAGEEYGLKALDEVIEALGQSAQAGLDSIKAHQQVLAAKAEPCWAALAELIWEFDAQAQDVLSAASETQAIAYQLGRGLAETYWALDPDQHDGATGWNFLLGEERCDELSRLIGRLSAYLSGYTPAAIASSIEVWKDVVKTPAWLGDVHVTELALYAQNRRWFELLILGQDPTTLVRPGAVMTNYRTLLRAVRLFWPQLVGTLVGAALLVVISVAGGAAWAKTISGFIAIAGLSVAGLTGLLKNSGQAMLKRLRQDSYTDLVAKAVQTAPLAPKKSDVETAISRRRVTPATPN
jgi:hypothetical protein